MKTNAIRWGGTFATLALTLLACAMPDEEPTGEASSAATKCSSDWLREKCLVATPYVPKPKGLRPLNGTGVPGAGCNEFSCSDFGGNFCRCAESLCPGSVGSRVYQQIVKCTYYYNCNQLALNHVIDIVCDPVPGDPTKKHCKCIEPQVSSGEYNKVYGEGDLGINETPHGEWCQDVVCKDWLGPSGWRGCGGTTKTTCDNVNGRDQCPKDCCVNADQTVPAWCHQCDVSKLAACKPPAPPVAATVK
ncbi:MAG: hypothetical protein KF819_31545 [Labilithrix sp.]|nr:hypothetical protein [Labilithrix sp.]